VEDRARQTHKLVVGWVCSVQGGLAKQIERP